MTSALDRSQYQIGAGLIDPGGTRFLLTIPKNASTFMSSWALQNSWLISNIQDHREIKEVIVILRDPINRWISGIAQYLNTYILQVHGPNGPIFPGDTITEHDSPMSAEQFIENYNQSVERLLFDVIDRFDDHVYEQNEFIDKIDLPKKKKFFLLEDDLISEISAYLSWEYPGNLDSNAGNTHKDIDVLQQFFRQRLQQRPELVQRIKKHYARDLELITNVRTR